jgi:von Willebrand factor A domain-containing protein 7
MLIALLAAPPTLAQVDRGQLPAPPAPRDGSLLPVDPTYFRLASETGGDFYFWEPGEFATARMQIPAHGDTVALGYGSLRGQSRELEIPVESGVRRLTVFAGAQRKHSARLLQPDGRGATGAGVSQQASRNMLVVTVNAPAPGIWRLQLAGEGLYSMSGSVQPGPDSDAPFVPRLAFVELRGRPGHEGLFPIEGEPPAGQWAQCSQTARGGIRQPRMRWVDAEGRPLGEPDLRQAEPDGDYRGRCLVPGVPFRTITTGVDDRGQRVQRIEPGLHSPRK